MGNSRNDEEFMEHFRYLISELYRVTIPGRLVSFHCMDIPAMKSRDGFIGIKDFSGSLLRMFINNNFIYQSKTVIWQDPLESLQGLKLWGFPQRNL